MSVTSVRKPRFIVLTAMLIAVAAVGAPNAFAQSKQLSLADILIALRSKKAEMPEKNKILTDAVKSRGVTFAMTSDIERELGTTGAAKDLIDAIKLRTAPIVVAKVEPEPAPVVPKPVVPPPPDFDFYKSRAASSIEKNDLDSAVADLTKALELKPNAASAYLDRGLILAKQDKPDAAIADFDKAIQFESSTLALNARASAKEKLGKAESAMGDYRKALDLDSKNEIASGGFNRLMAQKVEAEAKQKPEPVKEVVAQAPPTTAAPALALGSRVVSLGPLNGQAVRLAAPIYTAEHRRMGLQGKVTVVIALDEKGEIISAAASEGPKPLRLISEDAVKRTKFKPLMVQGTPVQSSGFITFNFVGNQ